MLDCIIIGSGMAGISAENVSAKNAEISPADKKEGNGAE